MEAILEVKIWRERPQQTSNILSQDAPADRLTFRPADSFLAVDSREWEVHDEWATILLVEAGLWFCHQSFNKLVLY